MAHRERVHLRPEADAAPWQRLLYTPEDRPVWPLIVTHIQER